MKSRLITAMLAIILALQMPVFAMAEEGKCDDWAMFNHDPSRSCLTTNQAAPPLLVGEAYKATAAIHSSIAMTDRYSVVGSDDMRIYCYDTHSFRIRWNYLTGNKVRSSPTIFGEVTICGSDDGYLYCLNLETGNEVWKFKTGDIIRSSPLVVNGKVYFASRDMKVYCLDALSGQKVWAFHTGAFVDASPTYNEHNKTILIGSYSKKLYCLNAENGRLTWEFETPSEVFAACSVRNEKIFFGTDGGQFYCLSDDGRQIWKIDVGAHVWATPALVEDKLIIPTGYDKMVRCLYQDTGEEVWNFRTENWNYSSPAVGGKYVFFGSDDQNLYCLYWKTGQLAWKGNLGYIIEASPVIYCEAVYVGTWGGTVQVFQPGPILEVEPQEIDFGIVTHGTTPFRDIIIRNARKDQFQTKLEGKMVTDEKHLSFSATEFFDISNGSEQKIRVTLDPGGLDYGNHQALLKISSNGGEFTMIIRWRIVSPAPPCLNVSPSELNFGFIKRGEEVSKTLTLSFDTDEEVSGIVMGEDRWIDVEPVSFTSINRKFLLKITLNGSRIPAGNEAQGRIVIATKNDVCQQVSVMVKVETEPRIEISMVIGDNTAFVNGRPVDMDVAPYITSKGRTMVPIRFISETFGADVKWIADKKEIQINRFDNRVKLWVGRPEMDVNDLIKAIPSPPEIKDGRTMVPFRAIAEAFGADVVWIAETKTVRMVFNP